MNNTLGEALKTALNNRKNDFSDFIWKGEKRKEGDKYVQDSEMIGKMTPERLRECYEHCQRMLYSDNPKHLGRYNVSDEVNTQINKCNVELFLRYCENSYLRRENIIPVPRSKMMINIRTFMLNSDKDAEKQGIKIDWNNISVQHLGGDLPPEFYDISIASALDGCTDSLGAFNKQHLTMTFITKMGIWFTKAEENELKNLSSVEKLKTVKEKLHLPEKLNLKFNDKGLSYHEMRAMLILPKQIKYSDMTTEQLITLRNKILIRFLKEVDGHIFSWKRLQKQIEIVARSRNIKLVDE